MVQWCSMQLVCIAGYFQSFSLKYLCWLRQITSIDKTQHGFRPGKSTTEPIFILQILQEKYREMNQGSTLAMCPLARMHFLGRRASSGHNNSFYAGAGPVAFRSVANACTSFFCLRIACRHEMVWLTSIFIHRVILPVSHLSHLEGSSTSVGRPGNCQSPVLAVENVDVRQSILLDISLDGIHVSQFRSSSRSHTFYLHVQHCSVYMAFISTSDMSIPA